MALIRMPASANDNSKKPGIALVIAHYYVSVLMYIFAPLTVLGAVVARIFTDHHERLWIIASVALLSTAVYRFWYTLREIRKAPWESEVCLERAGVVLGAFAVLLGSAILARPPSLLGGWTYLCFGWE